MPRRWPARLLPHPHQFYFKHPMSGAVRLTEAARRTRHGNGGGNDGGISVPTFGWCFLLRPRSAATASRDAIVAEWTYTHKEGLRPWETDRRRLPSGGASRGGCFEGNSSSSPQQAVPSQRGVGGNCTRSSVVSAAAQWAALRLGGPAAPPLHPFAPAFDGPAAVAAAAGDGNGGAADTLVTFRPLPYAHGHLFAHDDVSSALGGWLPAMDAESPHFSCQPRAMFEQHLWGQTCKGVYE